MYLLLNLFFATLSFANDSLILSKTSILEVGEKLPIHKSSNYHFNKKGKVAFHQQNSKAPFIIGKEPGYIEYQTGSKEIKKLLILSSSQKKFLNTTKAYVEQAKHLNFSMKGSTLTIEGTLYDLKEFSFLLNACEINEHIKLLLKYNREEEVTNKIYEKYGLKTFFKENIIYSKSLHHKFHRCLSTKNNVQKEFQTHIVLVEDELFNTISSGLGAENALNWVFTNELIVDNFSGSLDFRRIRNSLKQNLNFKTLISKDSPLTFSDGTEVQVVDQQGLFNSRNSWKKALTTINLELLSEDSPEVVINTKLNQTLRTGETGVFKTNSYIKKSSVYLNNWKQLISFNKESSSKSKNKIFKSLFLGKKTNSKTHSNYSLWIKVTEYD